MNLRETNLKYKKPLYDLAPNQVEYIVVHHTTVEKASPERLHDIHLGMGFSGIGYNDYIVKEGTVYIARGNKIGAQCKGYNSKSYGIGLEGNYSYENYMPEKQFQALVERIKQLKDIYPNAKVVRHSDLLATECPGLNFPWDRLMKAIEKPVLQTFFLDGKQIDLKTKLIEGTNYVTLRDIVDIFGYNIEYDSDTMEVKITK